MTQATLHFICTSLEADRPDLYFFILLVYVAIRRFGVADPGP